MNIRKDSKSIALLAILSSLVIAIEIFPIPGVTDIYTPAPSFTLDPTGIPIMIVYLGLGVVFSFITVAVAFIFIGYRNFEGALFKAPAEFFTLLGVIVAKLLLRKRELDWKKTAVVYVVFACIFRAIGMLFANMLIFNFLWGTPYNAGFALSTVYVPWNILQAIINVVGGVILFQLIPENLRMQAGFGEFRTGEDKYEELSEDEINSETE